MVLILYVLAGTAAGAAAGTLLGVAGSILDEPARLAVGTLLGAALAVLGVRAMVRGGAPPQLDRETPIRWVERGPIFWPLANGAALGLGAASRLGFWLWYSIPVGCFLVATPLLSGLIWASYGFARTAAAGWLWLLEARDPDRNSRWLMEQRERARSVSAVLMVVVGSATFLLLGL